MQATDPTSPPPTLVFAGEGLIELTLEGGRASLDCGGDAANAATMCALLGGQVRLLGRVGGDPLGRRLVDFWGARGVDTSAITVDPDAPTGLYVNEIPVAGGDAPRTFTYWRRGSAGSRWSAQELVAREILADVAAIVVTGITISVSESCARAAWLLVEHAHAHSIPTACVLNYRASLDPDRAALARLAAAVDVVIASTDDLNDVFPETSPEQLLKRASETGRELVVTDGSAGAIVGCSDGVIRQRAFPVSVRDTVGAGDALAGAYLCARFAMRERPLEALRWGVAAALVSVQRAGCASSYPDALDASATRCQLPQADAIVA